MFRVFLLCTDFGSTSVSYPGHTLAWVLFLCRDVIGEFYCASQLGFFKSPESSSYDQIHRSWKTGTYVPDKLECRTTTILHCSPSKFTTASESEKLGRTTTSEERGHNPLSEITNILVCPNVHSPKIYR